VTTVAAVIPSIPPRAGKLLEALASVANQTRPVDQISVAIDHERQGAAATRNRAFAAVDCEWTAFLDDDDLWRPQHVERLLSTAVNCHADLVYPWFDVDGGSDPLGREGVPFDPDALRLNNYIPVTLLVRTAALRDVGGFPVPGSEAWPHGDCEDWAAWLQLLNAGATFVHLPERTWIWRWDGRNTSGRADRW
jgi:glycosyltransferase involved in cell wall biosynthesis